MMLEKKIREMKWRETINERFDYTKKKIRPLCLKEQKKLTDVFW